MDFMDEVITRRDLNLLSEFIKCFEVGSIRIQCLFEKVALQGTLEQLKVCYDHGFRNFNFILDFNFSLCTINNLKFLIEKGIIPERDFERLIRWVVSTNDFELTDLVFHRAEQMVTDGHDLILSRSYALNEAVKNNNLEFYLHFIEQWDMDPFIEPVSEGSFNFYTRVSEIFEINDLQEMLNWGFYGGSIPIIEDLVSKGGLLLTEHFLTACENNRLLAVQYLLVRKIGNIEEGLEKAVGAGSLDVIKYLEELVPVSTLDWEKLFKICPLGEKIIDFFYQKLDPTVFINELFQKERFDSFLHFGDPLPKTLYEKKIDYSKISGKLKYKYAKTFLNIKLQRRRMIKFGWRWRDKWLVRSADPKGNGSFFKKWKKRSLELFGN